MSYHGHLKEVALSYHGDFFTQSDLLFHDLLWPVALTLILVFFAIVYRTMQCMTCKLTHYIIHCVVRLSGVVSGVVSDDISCYYKRNRTSQNKNTQTVFLCKNDWYVNVNVNPDCTNCSLVDMESTIKK